MPMLLKGSCRCGAVRFEVESHTPVPYQLCYCSVCRKQQGGGGYAINLAAVTSTLKVDGAGHLGLYRAEIEDDEHPHCKASSGERRFCRECGAGLWLYDPNWTELVHPFASAIDTELPAASERVHLMLKYKASWVKPEVRERDTAFDLYPDESIEGWHRKRGAWVE